MTLTTFTTSTIFDLNNLNYLNNFWWQFWSQIFGKNFRFSENLVTWHLTLETLVTLLTIENNNTNNYFVTFEKKRVMGRAFAMFVYNFETFLTIFDNFEIFWSFEQLQWQLWRLLTFETLIKIQTIDTWQSLLPDSAWVANQQIDFEFWMCFAFLLGWF